MEEGKNIIMIDDDEDDFLLLQNGFQTFATGISLTWFDSPQAFLAAKCWRQRPIDLLVLDLDLGAETGKYWQPKLLAHECCRDVPIVIYSGSEMPGNRQEMMNSGAADFIEKASASGQMQDVVARMRAQWT